MDVRYHPSRGYWWHFGKEKEEVKQFVIFMKKVIADMGLTNDLFFLKVRQQKKKEEEKEEPSSFFQRRRVSQ